VVKQAGAQVIPIDGKCMKGSYDRKKKQSALHVVSAWASEHRLLLGQVVEDKTNEIKAIPSLLELLDITGCVITIDAMGTQTEIATQIVGKGADYILSLNHPTLLAEVKAWFDAAQAIGFEGIEHSYDQRVEAGHHRRERDKFGWFALTKWVDFINNPNGRACTVSSWSSGSGTSGNHP